MKKLTKPSTLFLLSCVSIFAAVGIHGIWLSITQKGQFYAQEIDSFLIHGYYLWAYIFGWMLLFIVAAFIVVKGVDFFAWLFKKADDEWNEANQ